MLAFDAGSEKKRRRVERPRRSTGLFTGKRSDEEVAEASQGRQADSQADRGRRAGGKFVLSLLQGEDGEEGEGADSSYPPANPGGRGGAESGETVGCREDARDVLDDLWCQGAKGEEEVQEAQGRGRGRSFCSLHLPEKDAKEDVKEKKHKKSKKDKERGSESSESRRREG
eukprot:754765-Hanusia_phi.AAC.3